MRILHSACLSLFLTTALLTACSTTSHLPEGEQLYIGIDRIDYSDAPRKSRRVKNDTTGVITSIANAVEAVTDALEGRSAASPAGGTAAGAGENTDTKADAADFLTAKEEVDGVLAYAPNGALFGSSSLRSPLQTGLWIYNAFVDRRGRLGRWIFRNFSQAPVLVSNVSPEVRSKVAASTLRNYGYFSGRVDYEVITQKNPRKAKIAYHVTAGRLWRLDSIQTGGFGLQADSILASGSRATLLRRGRAFSATALAEERTRIERLLRNHGYYYYTAAHTLYEADTLQRKGHVQLRVTADPRRPDRARRPWTIGRLYVDMYSGSRDSLTRHLTRRNHTYSYSGSRMPVKPRLWRQAITQRTGQFYSLDHDETTVEKLQSLGIFASLGVSYVPRDTTAACDTLDMRVSALMDKLYNSSFEMNATLKSNQQIGPGVAYELSKRNAFGGGETVAWKIFGAYEWSFGAARRHQGSSWDSYELGTNLSVEIPSLLMPGLRRRRLRFPAKTRLSADLDWRNRSGFFQMISSGLSMTYNWQRRASASHELTVFALDFDKLSSSTAAFDSITAANPALYVSMRDQFIPSVGYTVTLRRGTSTSHPFMLQLSAKQAGNLVSAIYAVCGQPFDRSGKKILGAPFAQFIRLTAEAHKAWRLARRLTLASRLMAGAVVSYGNSLRAPYAEQFYTGGANSVRGFAVRTVGPGSYRSPDSRYAYIDQTGDFKLEANAELRCRLFGSLHGAVFLDAGNVWLLRADPLRPGAQLTAESLRRIAVGTGAGLRYDLGFLVLRLDMGIGLHAPYDTRRTGFYNLERFRDGMAFHFAIGYPF